ncbi:MAG: VWA domain-containing protein [Candidatus Thorarchaeota archaeon]|nr:VWA domain-containing protein [Candidatus Thorarchaeota archaeon]
MNLKATQGRNQKGLCFVSEDEVPFKEGVYQISYHGKTLLADIRTSANVPRSLIILDQQIFSWLSCNNESEVLLEEVTSIIPTCSEIRLSITSTRDLANRTIADAISKRVNDLHDDFDGLILQVGQSFQIDRLGIIFTVKSLNPMNTSNQAARIAWDSLEKIHLDPVESLSPFHIVCIVEVGAAAQISDVSKESENNVPRYEATLEAIRLISEVYSNYGSHAQFRGFAYSDEIIPFTLFDPETGNPTEVSSINSASLFIAFIKWIETLIPNHKGRASNPGEALKHGIESAEEFTKSNLIPTIILFFSSGVHTSGPNPVKIVKNKISSDGPTILCFTPGLKSNLDVMLAIAENSQGKAINVSEFEEVSTIIEVLMDLSGGGV